jgi:uncharacterized protein (TIGR02996 family)
VTQIAADPDLLRACLASPHDPAPRLVLADWLEERETDPLVCAALRAAGWWYVDSESGISWDFPMRALVPEPILFRDDFDNVDDGWTGSLPFAPIPDPPKCWRCGATADIEIPRRAKRWRCVDSWMCGKGRGSQGKAVPEPSRVWW